jgi:hypothetical protein
LLNLLKQWGRGSSPGFPNSDYHKKRAHTCKGTYHGVANPVGLSSEPPVDSGYAPGNYSGYLENVSKGAGLWAALFKHD